MVNVQPIEAMFNPSFIVRSFHVITTAGMTMAFVIASIAAFKLLRNRQPNKMSYDSFENVYDCWILLTLLSMLEGIYLQNFCIIQPEKLAAYEWHFDTSSHAKLLLFGVLDEDSAS